MDPTIEIPAWLRQRFAPERSAAVKYFRRLIDKGMLREIAEADYGLEADEHLAALDPIWRGAEFEDLHYWHPMEVLELMRWSEPESPNWKPGSTGNRGHKIRAFCCAVLLAARNHEPEKETLIQMLNSAYSLGDEALDASARFLSARIPELGREDDRPFFVLALAAIAQSLLSDLNIELEEELAAWIDAEE